MNRPRNLMTSTSLARGFLAGMHMTPAERSRGRFMRAPDGHENNGGGDDRDDTKTDDENKSKDKSKGKSGESNNDDKVDKAALDAATAAASQAQKDLEEARKQLKRFEGIDPDKARENAEKVTAAEEAARQAEKEKAEAEGNWERVREIMNEERDKREQDLKSEVDTAKAARDEALREAQNLRIENAFASSKYLTTETILSSSKARRLFGDHAEWKDGQVVLYDKPAGVSNRTMLVDGKGAPLAFDAAIQKIVEADDDADAFKRTKVKAGAGSHTDDGDPAKKEEGTNLDRIKRGLAELSNRD